MLEHEDEFDGVEKGDRPDRPGGGFKKQQKPAKFKKNKQNEVDISKNVSYAETHRYVGENEDFKVAVLRRC